MLVTSFLRFLLFFFLVITGATDGIGRAYAEEVVFYHFKNTTILIIV